MKNISGPKYIFLLLLFISLSPSLLGQSRGLRYGKQTSSFDLVIGGDLGFRSIGGNASNPTVQRQMENRKAFENQAANYRFGFNYYRGISGNLLLKTGVRIANPSLGISGVDTLNTTISLNLIEKESKELGLDYKYQYRMLEIPLGIKYVITGATCTPYIELVLSTNFYLNTRIKETSYDGVVRRTTQSEAISPVHFFANFAAGGDFLITNKLGGFSQLMVRYQLNDLRTGEVSERLFGIGLEAGIRYYLD